MIGHNWHDDFAHRAARELNIFGNGQSANAPIGSGGSKPAGNGNSGGNGSKIVDLATLLNQKPSTTVASPSSVPDNSPAPTITRNFTSGPLPGSVSPGYKPGYTPYVEGASPGTIAADVLGAPTGPLGVFSTLGRIFYQGITGRDLTNDIFGSALGSPGVQTGWTDPDANAGKRASRGDFSSLSKVFQPTAWLDDGTSPLISSLINPKTYSSADATIVR